jgi:serine kinase of HPr protein (carbohydrate metabolism regulator)
VTGLHNRHACCIVLDDRGVLITGRSGSGKSSLALALIRHCRAAGMFARFVGDDQVFLATQGGRLVARPPAAIAGLAEVHGLGPRPIPFEAEAVVDLVVDLVERNLAPRVGDNGFERLLGVDVQRLVLPERQAFTSMHAVLAALLASRFG